tara:strand:+ start:1619 stop:1780 length:162 start_codon:yes stop_codon:yes gene_type:complete
MAQSCPNCGTCTCTGTHLVTASNGKLCCNACVFEIERQIAATKPHPNNEQSKK